MGEQVDLDGPLHVRALPPQVGDAEHGGPDGEPCGEADVVHEQDQVARAQVAEAHQGQADHAWNWGRPM